MGLTANGSVSGVLHVVPLENLTEVGSTSYLGDRAYATVSGFSDVTDTV